MRSQNRQRGFTLFEILVVVFIIAVITGTAVLSVGILRDDRDVQREADRAVALFGVVKDEALLQGREFGIEFLETGYRFVEFDPLGERWADIPLDELLKTRTLPDDMELELYVDGQMIELDRTPANFSSDEDEDERAFGVPQYAPHVFVYSSGDMTPFELHITRYSDNARIAVRFDLLGNAEFIDDEELF